MPEPKDLADTILVSRPGKPRHDKNGTTLLWRSVSNGRQQKTQPRQGPTPIPRIVILFFPVSTGGFLRLLAQEPDEGCASEKNAAQARITPPLHHLSFFYTIHGAISTDFPFSLTHAGPCAIEFSGAEATRPVRPDFIQKKYLYQQFCSCHDEARIDWMSCW